MGQSLSQLYVHLIFATKYRQRLINKKIRDPLNAYLNGILKNLDSPSIQTNCVDDHVHILFRLSKNRALAKVVEEVKRSSSKWIKTVEDGPRKFGWQTGYAAFSVSSSVLPNVVDYIKRQEEHHQRKTLRDEIQEFMSAYDIIEYDEKFFWDQPDH